MIKKWSVVDVEYCYPYQDLQYTAALIAIILGE
jgi:hypothetical protein